MTDVVGFALDGGGTVLVAVDTPAGITPASGADGVVRKVGVSSGIQLTAEAGALIARTGCRGSSR